MGKGYGGEVAAAVCTLVCCLGLWFGLFFGLNYPEIQVNVYYKQTSCVVTSVSVPARYCCSLTCGCSGCFNGASSCSALVSSGQSQDPIACAAGNATGTCPPIYPSAIACCNGYYCCSRCCSTCRSCSRCGKSGTCCTSYSCNCYCCSSVDNQACSMSCRTCYSTVYYYVYEDVDGNEHGPLIWVLDHGTNKAAADAQAIQYAVGTSRVCYYDPDNFNNVVYTKSYTWWKWFLTAWPSAFLFIMLAALSAPLIESCTRNSDGDTYMLVVPIWCGCILPLIIFLPIALGGAIPDSSKKGLLVAVCELVWAGWFFGLAYWSKEKQGITTFIVYFIFVIIPLGVVLPLGIYSDGSTKAALVAIGVILPVLSLCWFAGYEKFADAVNRANLERMDRDIQARAVNVASHNSHDAEMASLAREREQAAKARAELEALRRENDELERRLKREQADLDAYAAPPASAPYQPYGAQPVAAIPYGAQPYGAPVAAVAVGSGYQPYAQPPPQYNQAPPSYDTADGYAPVTKQ